MEKEKIYYRVTVNGEGVYNALKRKVSNDVWKEFLLSEKFNWLPKPPNYSCNNISYFTYNGYKKFVEVVMPVILDVFDKNDILVEEFFELRNIIYFDDYQVVCEIFKM